MSTVNSEIKSGAWINFWGVAGKMSAPAFLILVNRYYGAELFGYFVTANMVLDIGLAFLTFGFKDGILMHVSKFADEGVQSTKLYNSLTNAFVWSIGLSILFILLIWFAGEALFALFYEKDFAANIWVVLSAMVLAAPLISAYWIILAATQGLKIMKYDAIINGGFRPLMLLICLVGSWYIWPNLKGLGIGFVMAHSLVFMVSVAVYFRNFSLLKQLNSISSFSLDSDLLTFAIPQNINMTLNRFITGVDVLMLPMFGISAVQVGYYAAGSMIIREVRNVKLIFSTAFAPQIVRLFDSGRIRQLSYHFSETSRWVSAISLPLLFTIAIFRQDLLLLLYGEYTYDTLFMLFLLPVPYLYGSFSLAGNIIIMTGHSRLSLFNTVVSSMINIGLNFWLIPQSGLIGAAIASSLTMLLLSILELMETYLVVGASLIFKKVFQPHFAGLMIIGFWLIWEQMYHYEIYELIGKVILSGTAISLFFLMHLLLTNYGKNNNKLQL